MVGDEDLEGQEERDWESGDEDERRGVDRDIEAGSRRGRLGRGLRGLGIH